MDAYEAITGRRSIRRFDGCPVDRALLDRLLRAACLAPAPHHTRPWRFVVLETPDSRRRLADGMGAAWRRDLEEDGAEQDRVEVLLARSRQQIEKAPALVLACLVDEGLCRWPDKRRRRAEWRMAVQSMGCALENVLVAAHAEGLAGHWISAPLFCQDAVRAALDLPSQYEPQALIALGYAASGVSAGPRAEPDLEALVRTR